MDTITHSLVGVAISRVGFKQRVAYATTACIIACNLPDLDVIYSWPGIRYIEYHRGLLHSVWFLPIWGLVAAFGLRWAVKRWPVPDPWKLALRLWPRLDEFVPNDRPRRAAHAVPPLWIGFVLGVVCAGSHILLDWTNAYGIRLFAPFHQTWYALDWLPIFDPWIWLLFAAFLCFPMLLGLISNEVGTAKHSAHRVSAALALILLCGWVGLRARQHNLALELLNQPNVAGMYNGEQPYDWSAFPNVSTPFQWQAVVDLPSSYLVTDINAPWDALDYGNVHPVRNFIKPPSTVAIQIAQRTHTGGIMMWFARYPMSDEETEGDDSVVYITDMRFANGVERPGLRAIIRENASKTPVSQSFAWHR